MQCGRKPKAREIQLAEGRHLKNPQRFKNEVPATSPDEPALPLHLKGQAAAAWESLEAVLRAAGLWSASYQVTIELYCETYANYRTALERVQQTGQALVTKNKDGTPDIRRNPFRVELHRYKEELIKISAEFGLTPSSRSRIMLQEGSLDPDNPLLRLMA